MTDSIQSKWEANKRYCLKNLQTLKAIFIGKNIIIVAENVKYAANGFSDWVPLWNSLSEDEKLEAYTTYIRKENEFFVV